MTWEHDEVMLETRGIYAPMGEVILDSSPEQELTFVEGREISEKRFLPGNGLGPTGNVTSCGACHENR